MPGTLVASHFTNAAFTSRGFSCAVTALLTMPSIRPHNFALRKKLIKPGAGYSRGGANRIHRLPRRRGRFDEMEPQRAAKIALIARYL